eukprot:6994794-Prymnesium_polylepis.1
MAWLTANYKFKASPTLDIFAHPKVGAAAQRYIKELVEKQGRKYSYGAKMAASLVAVASFVSVRRGGSPDGGVVGLRNSVRSISSAGSRPARMTNSIKH